MASQLGLPGLDPNVYDEFDRSKRTHWKIQIGKPNFLGNVLVTANNGSLEYPFTFPETFSDQEIISYYRTYGAIKGSDTYEFI